MKRIRVLPILAALALSLLGAGGTQERTPVAGILTSVKGKVQVKRALEKDTAPAKVGQFVREGDVIQTGPKQRVSLAFTEGAEVRINENTKFEVRGGGAGKTRKVGLSLGQIWTRLLHKEADLEIRTQVAVAAVRGTEADVEMRNLLTVKVYEGLVDLMNSQGKHRLSAGQISKVTG